MVSLNNTTEIEMDEDTTAGCYERACNDFAAFSNPEKEHWEYQYDEFTGDDMSGEGDQQ